MLDKTLRFFIILLLAAVGGVLGHRLSPALMDFLSTEVLRTDLGFVKITVAGLLCIIIGAAVGGMLGSIVSPYLIRRLKRFTVWVEQQLNKMPLHDVIAGTIGLAIGLIIANLLGGAFAKIPVVGDYIPVVFSIVLGYLGIISPSRSAKN